MLGEVFQRFVEKSPIAVMVRGVLERVLGAKALDAWYEQTAQKQYTRTLLFLTLYELMSAVVFAIKPSVHAAYQGREAEVGASIVSVLSQAQGDRAADLGGAGSVQYIFGLNPLNLSLRELGGVSLIALSETPLLDMHRLAEGSEG